MNHPDWWSSSRTNPISNESIWALQCELYNNKYFALLLQLWGGCLFARQMLSEDKFHTSLSLTHRKTITVQGKFCTELQSEESENTSKISAHTVFSGDTYCVRATYKQSWEIYRINNKHKYAFITSYSPATQHTCTHLGIWARYEIALKKSANVRNPPECAGYLSALECRRILHQLF